MSLTLREPTQWTSALVAPVVWQAERPQDTGATPPATEQDISRKLHVNELIGRRAAIPQIYSLAAQWFNYALRQEGFGERKFYVILRPTGTNEANTALEMKVAAPLSFQHGTVAKAILGLNQVRTLSLLSQIGDLSKRTVAQDADSLLALEKAKADTVIFASKLSPEIQAPTVFTAEDGEVILEWKRGDLHAVVDFQGDGFFGYALLSDGRFIPGEHEGDLSKDTLPADLTTYLKSFSSNERQVG
jgi:hypothetical protein